MKHIETLHVCSNNLYNRIGGKYNGGGTADPSENPNSARGKFADYSFPLSSAKRTRKIGRAEKLLSYCCIKL